LLIAGVPEKMIVTPEEEQVIENGGEVIYNVELVDQSGNQTTGTRTSISCKARPDTCPLSVDLRDFEWRVGADIQDSLSV
jgi:hypothetical protein